MIANFYRFVGWTWVILHHVYHILPFFFTKFFSVVCSIWGVGSNPKKSGHQRTGDQWFTCTINFMVVLNVQTNSNGMWLIWWILTCCWCMMMFCAWLLLLLLVLWLQTVNSAFVWFLFISHFWMCPEVKKYGLGPIVSGLRAKGRLGGAWLSCFFPEILRWRRSCVSMDSPCPCNTEFEDRGPTGCPIDFWKALIQSWFLWWFSWNVIGIS